MHIIIVEFNFLLFFADSNPDMDGLSKVLPITCFP